MQISPQLCQDRQVINLDGKLVNVDQLHQTLPLEEVLSDRQTWAHHFVILLLITIEVCRINETKTVMSQLETVMTPTGGRSSKGLDVQSSSVSEVMRYNSKGRNRSWLCESQSCCLHVYTS